jgi:hypothetical protein
MEHTVFPNVFFVNLLSDLALTFKYKNILSQPFTLQRAINYFSLYSIK